MRYIKYIITTQIIALVSIFAISAQEYSNKLSPSANILYRKNANSESNKLMRASLDAETIYISAYLLIEDGFDIDTLSDFDCKVNMELDNILSVRFPLDSIISISEIEGVNYIEAGGRVSTKLDIARNCVNYDKIEAAVDLPSPYTGKDVIVGIVDEGFQFDHIAFTDSNGDLRIKRVWVQGTSGTPPDGFSYGTELKDEASIRATKYDGTDETHATHVTGIAAGAASQYSNYYGIAQECDLVLVSVNPSGDELLGYPPISDGIKYIYDYAESQNKPVVVNISLGVSVGVKDGESMFDIICDAMQGEGQLLVGSSGNEGELIAHIAKEFTSDSDTLRTYLTHHELSLDKEIAQFRAYGEVGDEIDLQVVIVKYATGEIIYQSDVIENGSGFTYFETTIEGDKGLTSAVYCQSDSYPTNGRPYVEVYSEISSRNEDYALGVKVTSKEGTQLHALTDGYYSQFPAETDLEGWTVGDSDMSIGELGGTGKEIISVGSYRSRDPFDDTAIIGELSVFSSRGPTLDGRMKPDIAAPGEYIVSAYSNLESVMSNSLYSKYFNVLCDTITIDDENYYYSFMRGTSMAAPMVTGIIATWLQANPTLSPDDIRAILSETAIKDEYTGDEDNNSFGYGKIDAWGGLIKALNMASIVTDDVVVDKDITVYKSGNECKVLFGVDANDVNVMVYSISGHLVSTNYHPTISAGSSISIPSLSGKSGIYIVVVSGNSFTQHSKVIL